MSGQFVSAQGAAITAVTTTGFITVANANLFYLNAVVWLSKAATTSARYKVVGILYATNQLALRFWPNTGLVDQGQSDVSAFNAGRIDMEAQFIDLGTDTGTSTTLSGSSTALQFISTQISGADAFGVTTNGARFHFGAGASDYASSNGTTVTFAGPVAIADTLTVSSGFNVLSGSPNVLRGSGSPFINLFEATGGGSIEMATATGGGQRLQLGGPTNVFYCDTLKGTGNTSAIVLSHGAKCQIGASSTITGTTEVQLDGAAGTTLAAMRAASPKLLTNTYGTLIFE